MFGAEYVKGAMPQSNYLQEFKMAAEYEAVFGEWLSAVEQLINFAETHINLVGAEYFCEINRVLVCLKFADMGSAEGDPFNMDVADEIFVEWNSAENKVSEKLFSLKKRNQLVARAKMAYITANDSVVALVSATINKFAPLYERALLVSVRDLMFEMGRPGEL